MYSSHCYCWCQIVSQTRHRHGTLIPLHISTAFKWLMGVRNKLPFHIRFSPQGSKEEGKGGEGGKGRGDHKGWFTPPCSKSWKIPCVWTTLSKSVDTHRTRGHQHECRCWGHITQLTGVHSGCVGVPDRIRVLSESNVPSVLVPSVLWCCRLGGRKGIWPVKNWVVGAGKVICLERGADLHTAQLMPLPLTVSYFSKIQIGFTFPVPVHLGSPGQRAVKRV